MNGIIFENLLIAEYLQLLHLKNLKRKYEKNYTSSFDSNNSTMGSKY